MSRFVFEVLLMRKQQLIHGPELALCAGSFCGFGGHFGVGVYLAQREVPEDKAQLFVEVRQHDLQRRVGLKAGRAFEVAVFDKRDRRRRAATDVVYGLVGFEDRVRRGQGGHGVHLSAVRWQASGRPGSS
jgi:hypothetical protein